MDQQSGYPSHPHPTFPTANCRASSGQTVERKDEYENQGGNQCLKDRHSIEPFIPFAPENQQDGQYCQASGKHGTENGLHVAPDMGCNRQSFYSSPGLTAPSSLAPDMTYFRRQVRQSVIAPTR